MKRQWILVVSMVWVWSMAGCVNLHQASLKGDFDQVRNLIAEGASVNERGGGGETPLMAAAKTNDLRVAELLIFNGADVHLKDDSGHAALWYAYEHDGYDVFKHLIECGAKIDFAIGSANASSVPKMKMLRVAREYLLYKQIVSGSASGSVALFDEYFSTYPNGVYSKQVEAELKKLVEVDYERVKYSESIPELEKFLQKYAGIGRNVYIVTVKVLNIRSRNVMNADVVGSYRQGDKIHVKQEQFGWLQTDKGWISGQYVKRLLENHIPVIRSYMLSVSHKIDGLKTRPVRKPPVVKTRPTPKPEQTTTEPAPAAAVPIAIQPPTPSEAAPLPQDDPQPAAVTPQPVKSDLQPETAAAIAQQELDTIMANPTLDKLRDYLDKYKNNQEARPQFLKARQKYMSLLMGE